MVRKMLLLLAALLLLWAAIQTLKERYRPLNLQGWEDEEKRGQ